MAEQAIQEIRRTYAQLDSLHGWLFALTNLYLNQHGYMFYNKDNEVKKTF